MLIGQGTSTVGCLRGQNTLSGDRPESPSPWKASTWAIQDAHPFPEHSGRGQRNAGTRILREQGSSFLQKIKQPPFPTKDKACKMWLNFNHEPTHVWWLIWMETSWPHNESSNLITSNTNRHSSLNETKGQLTDLNGNLLAPQDTNLGCSHKQLNMEERHPWLQIDPSHIRTAKNHQFVETKLGYPCSASQECGLRHSSTSIR